MMTGYCPPGHSGELSILRLFIIRAIVKRVSFSVELVVENDQKVRKVQARRVHGILMLSIIQD